MEGLEIGRFILPRRLAHGVDDERGGHHDNTSDDQHRVPHGVATHRNLSGRNKAEDERQQRAEETHTRYQPHQAVSFASDAERTVSTFHVVA